MNQLTKYDILKKYFGYSAFRGAQEELIDSILAGKDTLGIMPTGAGKSLCFQLPALMLDGITLVISPLISLMKDQVGNLNQMGIHAAYLNSSLTQNQYFKALGLARQGRYPIIYVAPERLMTEAFLDFALHVKIAALTVDEAHCISQWGQDFRPSYLKIVEFIARLPVRPVVSAFTATATKEVREDIVRILRLREPTVITTGFDRSNLYLGVTAPKDRYAALRAYLSQHAGQGGIIYCLTRKQVEEVSERLVRDGFSVTRYHAGLSDEERRKNQEDFIYDRVPVMVATNAFGMGIDRSDVRFVLHYGMPKNLEAYYQEAGRAGRDGEPAECILLYSGRDVVTNQLFIEHNRDNEALSAEVRQLVLERDRERLRQMTFYCTTNECLRAFILNYFGEYGSCACGNCSNCLTVFEEADVTEAAQKLLGCVRFCGQRYGVTVILDTLRGASTAKIRNYGLTDSPFYGALGKEPLHRLRQLLNYLQREGYAAVTNDAYAIVKLTEKSEAVLNGEEKLQMKFAKEKEPAAGAGKRGTAYGAALRKIRGGHFGGFGFGKTAAQLVPRPGSEDRGAVYEETDGSGVAGGRVTEAVGTEEAAFSREESLFEELRELRRELAKEAGVPPYVVFSDKTLAQMCIMKPRTKAEMLAVSGVGEHKFEKYGAQFLARITGK